MKTNKPSEIKNQDVNENSHEKRNNNQPENKMNTSQQRHRNKGTGMSSEAGSNQTEKSWQGTDGGQSGTTQNKSDNNNHKK